jgi:hypothetical protein
MFPRRGWVGNRAEERPRRRDLTRRGASVTLSRVGDRIIHHAAGFDRRGPGIASQRERSERVAMTEPSCE